MSRRRMFDRSRRIPKNQTRWPDGILPHAKADAPELKAAAAARAADRVNRLLTRAHRTAGVEGEHLNKMSRKIDRRWAAPKPG